MQDLKPFKTVGEHIELLEHRGLSFLDKDSAASFLLSEGYYSVINGYKSAFIDRQASDIAGEDRYSSGLPFEYFRLLYTFDAILRRKAMDVLLVAESTMKTTVTYAFCDKHRERDAYLNPANYCSRSDFHDARNYTRGLIRLLSTLQGIRDNRHRKSYIEHYVKKYESLPLWVAAKCMTFGNTASFYEYQQQSVKTKSCIAMAQALGRKSMKMKHLTYAFRTLPEFRNICAHNERLYCAGVGKNRDKKFPELLRALSYVVQSNEMSEFVAFPIAFLDELGSSEPELKKKILEGMNISEEELKKYAEGQFDTE